MDIFNELNLKPVKTEPDVWISRLVIFEKITPEPVIIRDIPLSRGLNIIWAEETEDDIPSAEITGHSAGKTTFCRFLRYVLGEQTYGTRINMELIQESLPNGYVAAELHVQEQKWAVLRPIGKGRNSYIKHDSTVEELLRDRSHPAYLETYARELGLEKLLDELETGGIVRTGEPIQWGHILAWCTRDQEARFQNIYDWRSPRSESDTPAFRFPKAGPLFVMRAALGLFMPDELKGEERLAKLQQDQENLDKEMEKLKREPQFRINLYDAELRKHLRNILPDEPAIETLQLHSGNLLPDLNRLTAIVTSKIETNVVELEKERRDFQESIDNLGAKIRQLELELGALEELFNLKMAEGQELDDSITKRQKDLQLFTEYRDKRCLGGILFRDCEQVQKFQSVLQIKQLQDAKAMKAAEAERIALQQRLEQQKQQLRSEVDRSIRERQNLQLKRDTLLTNAGEQREQLRELKLAREGIETWIKKRDQVGGYKELDDCRKSLENTSNQIKLLEQQLSILLSEHDESRKLLASIFSGAVRAVLPSGTYDGRVSLNNRELAFYITHGSAMSGEAMETLSVLLTDVASLVYSTVSTNAHLPGFLLHDSPREADLGIRIYRGLIRFVASLQVSLGGADNCPFQYILTTTTAPPSELQNERFVKLQLNALKPSGMLLRRDISPRVNNDISGLY